MTQKKDGRYKNVRLFFLPNRRIPIIPTVRCMSHLPQVLLTFLPGGLFAVSPSFSPLSPKFWQGRSFHNLLVFS